jgi:GH24 family phage-related lysozyme (muramidase)|tara:strand:- start:18 stop:461 length:444 start_codon:yes stop_codon:yes gene_type:complete
MRCNDAGIEIIKKYEGCSLRCYLDPIGIPTIGYGSIWGLDHSRLVSNHRDITENEAEYLLKRELLTTENAVARMVRTALTENQFSAVCCLVYNVGSGRFRSSTIKMKLNRQDFEGAANEFWKWRRAGGKILRGLVRRREEEKQLFLR